MQIAQSTKSSVGPLGQFQLVAPAEEQAHINIAREQPEKGELVQARSRSPPHQEARRADSTRKSLLACKTVIGIMRKHMTFMSECVQDVENCLALTLDSHDQGVTGEMATGVGTGDASSSRDLQPAALADVIEDCDGSIASTVPEHDSPRAAVIDCNSDSHVGIVELRRTPDSL